MIELGNIEYAVEPKLTPEEFVDVLIRSTLSERRPIKEIGRVLKMLSNSDIILTARNDDKFLVGVSRAITDFSYCTYLSDLAVDVRYQRRGIGRQLIDKTYELAGGRGNLILLAAPAAQEYYPKIGMTKHESCWLKKSPETPKPS